MENNAKNRRRNRNTAFTSKAVFKKRVIKVLESMYVPNPGMNTDIDSYNFGIYDSIKNIKEKF